jgi:hypothetical protein
MIFVDTATLLLPGDSTAESGPGDQAPDLTFHRRDRSGHRDVHPAGRRRQRTGLCRAARLRLFS